MAVIEGAQFRNDATEGDPTGFGPYRNAGAPTGSTLANIAFKGALLIDTTNAKLYINTGSKASPTWTVVGSQS
jgi:hypothetical protein